LMERLYFDPGVFVAMDKGSFDGLSLSHFVEQRYGLVPRGGRQNFRVYRATRALSDALQVSASTPLLLVRRLLDFPRAAGAVYAELFCHTDEFVFAQDIGDFSHA
jgi:GntR family transcriptional regulator